MNGSLGSIRVIGTGSPFKTSASSESGFLETLAASSYLNGPQTAAAGIVKSLSNPILLMIIMVSANALLETVQRAAYSLQRDTIHKICTSMVIHIAKSSNQRSFRLFA